METIDWLLQREPYVQYATRINILKQKKKDLEELRKEVLSDPRIKEYLKDISDFNGILVKGHKNPNLPIHKLGFLLDIGLDSDVPEINQAMNIILSNIDELGIYKSLTNVPKGYGGSGEDTLGWALCDAPLMISALIRLNVDYEKYIKKGVEFILNLNRENGFPCTVSKELGKFRGPGKKDDCCPYATLITIKMLSLIPEYKNSEIAINGANVLLDLWEQSKEVHPYMFFMGTDFRKLKAPAIWYDIVSVVDCLSGFENIKRDQRFLEMVEIIEGKKDKDSYFTPESIYLKCKDWDFGQKKESSPWLTYLCYKILNSYDQNKKNDVKISKFENPIRLKELNPEETLLKAGFNKNAILCDIGAGTGIFSIAAAKISKEKIYALEISDEMIEILNEKKKEKKIANLEIRKVISETLPMDDGSCDFALMSTVFHEIDLKENMLNEIYRILNKKGRLLIIEFHKKETPMGPPTSHRISEEFVKEIAENNGFVQGENIYLGENFYCLVFEKKHKENL